MNYHAALAWLYSTQSFGIKLGLENIRRLLDELGVPRWLSTHRPTVFHVAGTNGKGSVCAMLDAICRAEGIRTALFTSPHLISFRERIQLNGAEIPEADVAAGLTRIRDLVADWETPPTFFEIATALALAWFQSRDAEAVVLETGLGGRLDSTNAVVPAVTLITSIGMDHRQYLGDTLAAIAHEKAGIFKPGVPAVSVLQTPEAGEVLEKVANRIGAPLRWIGEPVAMDVALVGSHQKLNAALAIAGLRAAGVPVSDIAVASGLRDLVWPGRFQRVAGPGGVELVLDGAHNEAAMTRLVLTWREVFGVENPVIVLGVVRDKDLAAICRTLSVLATEVIVTPVRNARSCSGEELAHAVRKLMPGMPCRTEASVETALATAAARASTRGCQILVTGSLFLVGEALACLEGRMAESSVQ